MKKYLFLAVAATAMFVSCSNDEVVDMPQGRAIAFDTFVNKSTRAAEDVTKANLSAFEVYGWRGENLIFDKQTVTASNGTCTYTPVQYWVGGYAYNFEAVAPKNGEKGVTFSATKGASTITFISDSETDLIYATAEKDLSNTVDVTTNPGTVDLTFGHLLSRVKFTFKNGFAANSDVKITVENVAITNAGTTGVYTPATSTWAAATATQKVDFASTNIAGIAGTNEAETEHKYLIPYAVGGYTLTFKVTMAQGGVSDEYEHSVNLPTLTLEAGNSYDFIAELKAENINPEGQMFPIVFTADVTAWEDFTDNGQTVTVD